MRLHNTAAFWRGRAAYVERQWVAKMLWPVPDQWRGRVVKGFERRNVESDAGARKWLTDLNRDFQGLRVPVGLTDSDIVEMAARRAAEAMGAAEVAPGVYLSEPAALRRRLDAFVGRYGIKPPEPLRVTRTGRTAGVSDSGAIARMCCPLWWRRKLREAQARALEGKAIELGFVHRRAEIYASNATVERRQQQRTRNAAGLDATEAINRDTGEVFRLADLAAASVANPRIRRGELMTRIAGFEAIAKGMEHAAEFVTITAPSRYHPKRTGEGGGVYDNPRYTGETPRQAQQYLARLWANIRAKLHRVGIAPYGFRIAEPHHDATPHWHMLLFVAPWLTAGRSAVARLRAIIRRYALKVDGREPGAKAVRVTFKAIDWNRGSAAGYVAKYVSKNIDGGGYQVQGDTEGGPGDIFPGHRVEAWASTWGIRQFQQVGGPPVGVWRELRRLEKGPDYPPAIEAARAAADCGRSGHDETGAAGNWRRYVEVMGGPIMRRADRPIGIARTWPGEVWNYMQGAPEPANLSRYGEVVDGAVYGLVDRASTRAFATVRYRWEIRGARNAILIQEGAGGFDSSVDGRGGQIQVQGMRAIGECEATEDQGAGFGSVFQGRVAEPWSPVNNCSRAIPPALPWEVLRQKAAESDRGIWLEGAAFSAWEALNGGGDG